MEIVTKSLRPHSQHTDEFLKDNFDDITRKTIVSFGDIGTNSRSEVLHHNLTIVKDTSIHN